MDTRVLRILDANFNRSREGLRVCEEIARFYMDNKALSKELKKARHAISDRWKAFPAPWSALLRARDIRADVGKKPSSLEGNRKNVVGIFLANAQRCKESLRALEEFSKLINDKHAEKFKKIRFQVYAIEKKARVKLEALCDHGA